MLVLVYFFTPSTIRRGCILNGSTDTDFTHSLQSIDTENNRVQPLFIRYPLLFVCTNTNQEMVFKCLAVGLSDEVQIEENILRQLKNGLMVLGRFFNGRTIVYQHNYWFAQCFLSLCLLFFKGWFNFYWIFVKLSFWLKIGISNN